MKQNMKKLLGALLAVALLAVCVLGAMADGTEKTTMMGFYFDTVVTITFYGADDALEKDVHAACAHYENLLSKTVEGSDVWRINHANGEPVTVDPETWNILYKAKQVNQASNGAFTITIAPLTALWDFTGGTNRMPTEEQLADNLPLVDDDQLVLGPENTVSLPAGMEIDLGGIAKGYIADKVADMCRERTTGCLISLGGNVYCTGKKPNGKPYTVGIKDPFEPNGDPLYVVSLYDGTVVTSGTYERFFEKDGVVYHHILDPKTGISSDSGLVSATIIGTDSMMSDAYATACIVLGMEDALRLLEAEGLEGLLIDENGQAACTDGFVEHFSLLRYK